MKWKQWRRGLWVSALDGLTQGVIALGGCLLAKLDPWQTAKVIAGVILVNIAKSVHTWIKAHPVEKIEETMTFTREQIELMSAESTKRRKKLPPPDV